MVQNPANYAPDKRLALSGSDRFSDPASDIIGTLKAAFNSTLVFRPNTVTMGREAGAVSPRILNWSMRSKAT